MNTQFLTVTLYDEIGRTSSNLAFRSCTDQFEISRFLWCIRALNEKTREMDTTSGGKLLPIHSLK